MIITLMGADFSQSNIGTLSSWRITRSLGSGATYEGVTSVDKGASFSATVTIAEGYELGSSGVTVTMGSNIISAATVNGNVITITIAEVTGNIVIKVPTVNVNTGEEEDPDVPVTPDEPKIINYFNPDDPEIKTGGFTALEGKWRESSVHGESGYISCVPGDVFRRYYIDDAGVFQLMPATCVSFYDANKTLLYVTQTDYTAPANAAYMKTSFGLARRYGKFMVTKNQEATEFVEYNAG